MTDYNKGLFVLMRGPEMISYGTFQDIKELTGISDRMLKEYRRNFNKPKNKKYKKNPLYLLREEELEEYKEQLHYPQKIYAMYKNDKIICVGTIDEIANLQGLKRDTVLMYTYDCYIKKMEKRGGKNYRRLVLLDET